MSFEMPAADESGGPGLVRLSPRYSRFVGLMKFALPLVAVGLIALVVTWPAQYRNGEGFRMTFADLEPDTEGDLGVVRARFAGADGQDRPFLITAERATQRNERFEVFELETLQADITLEGGTWISMSAVGGTYERAERRLRLEGPIDIFTNAGYELHAADAAIDLAAGRVATALPVEGHGPMGSVRADSMEFFSEGSLLRLQGGVRGATRTSTGP